MAPVSFAPALNIVAAKVWASIAALTTIGTRPIVERPSTAASGPIAPPRSRRRAGRRTWPGHRKADRDQKRSVRVSNGQRGPSADWRGPRQHTVMFIALSSALDDQPSWLTHRLTDCTIFIQK
jgi:hypothetical protein